MRWAVTSHHNPRVHLNLTVCSSALYYSLQVPPHSTVFGRNLLPLTTALHVHVTLVWLQPATSQTGTPEDSHAARPALRTDASVQLLFITVRALYSCLCRCARSGFTQRRVSCVAHCCQVTGNVARRTPGLSASRLKFWRLLNTFFPSRLAI